MPVGIMHLTPPELAERWRISPRTLERWRADGGGPAWLRLKGRVLYRHEDVLAFERAQLEGLVDGRVVEVSPESTDPGVGP